MSLDKIKSFFWPLVFTLIFLILTLPNLLTQNLIGDEAVYIVEGDHYLHTPYSFYNNSGSPHFLKSLSALFFYTLPLNRDYQPYFQTGNTNVYTAANFVYIQNAAQANTLIPLARMPHLILALIFGLALYYFTQKYISHRAALITLALYTFHNLFLAQASTANLDIGVTAFTFFTIVSLYHYFTAAPKSRKWLILTGILLGIAQLTKISAILLYPFFLLTPFILGQHHQFKKIITMFAVSILTIWAFYGFQIGAIILPKDDPAGLESVYGGIPPISQYKSQITDFFKLPIFPAGAFLNNFTYQFTHSFYGHTVYLNGQFSDVHRWYLIPVLFIYKNSLIFLALTLTSIILIFKTKLYKNTLTRFLLVWLAMLIFWSLTNKLQLGIRYFLPAFPILFILIAKATQSYTKPMIIALTIYAISNLSVYPNFFTYTNEYLRTQNPINYISDSDYDWGQSVYKIAPFQKKHNLYPLYLKSYGGANTEFYGIQLAASLTEAFAQKQSGYFAFSHSSLVGFKETDPPIFDYFASRTPDHIIDGTIYVYKISFQ